MRFWVKLLKSLRHRKDEPSPLHGTEGLAPEATLCPSQTQIPVPAALAVDYGHSPSALSTCSNLGRSWMWRSFSTSGAPRWVLPATGVLQ